MDDGLKWFLLLIVLAFDGLFLAALVTKYLEVKRASFWAAAPGKIVSSRAEARRVGKMSSGGVRNKIHDTELRNFAAVKYAFEADGKLCEGRRISLNEDVGNFQVAEKLQRYPVGAPVTVYYDRNRPEQNVLERDVLSSRSFEIAILVGVLIGLGCLFLVLSSDNIMMRLSQFLPNSGQSFAAAFVAVMAALVVAFAYGLKDQAAQTRAWPSTSGLVLGSDVETVKVGPAFAVPLLNNRRLFRDRTIYNYSVDGVTYRSDRVSIGAQTYATFGLFARNAARRFKPGSKVDVFYNPKTPTEAVLVRGAPGLALVWLVAVGMFGLAAKLAALF